MSGMSGVMYLASGAYVTLLSGSGIYGSSRLPVAGSSNDPFSINADPYQVNAPDLFARLGSSHKITSRFSDKINERAWALLEENFTPAQWGAFQDGKTVELHNKAKTHRLLINQSGSFMVMRGDAGEGVTLEQGAIREGSFPMGDEMKSFIEWFIERTEELLSRWGCSNYTIRPLSVREEDRAAEIAPDEHRGPSLTERLWGRR